MTARGYNVRLMRRLHIVSACLALLLLALGPRPAPADEGTAALQFHRAYEALTQADAARDDDRLIEAIGLYGNAATAYARLARRYPDWQPQVVAFRIAHCRNQAVSLNRYLGNDAPSPPLPPQPGPAPPEGADTLDAVDIDNLTAVLRGLMEDGNTDDARALVIDALAVDPDNITARLWLGAIQCQSGRFNDAMHMIGSVVDEAPGNAEARLLLATAYTGTGRLKEAEDEIRFALDLNPNLTAAHYDLARLLLSADPPDIENARRHYVECRRLGGTPDPDLEARLDQP